MSKMGSVIMEIQSMAGQGKSVKEIAKYTNSSEDFVREVIKDFFEISPDEEYYYVGGCAQE